MNRLAFRALLLLLCLGEITVGCGGKEPLVVLPATAPTPPSTTPPRSDLTVERRQDQRHKPPSPSPATAPG